MTAAGELRLHPSAAQCAAVAFLHGFAALCVLFSLDGMPLVLVLGGLLLSLVAWLRRLRLYGPQAVVGIRWRDGGLQLAGPQQPWTAAEVLSGLAPLPWLAVLRARDVSGHRRLALLTPDACDPEAFRAFRVWLRWHRRGKSGDPGLN